MRKYLIGLVVLLLFIAPASASVISINPVSITKTIGETTYVSVQVTNTHNEQLNITVTKSQSLQNYVTVTPSTFSIGPNDYKNIEVKLLANSYSGTLYYNWGYTHNNTTHNGVFEQQVSVTLRQKDILISPQNVSLKIPVNTTATVYTSLVNPTEKTLHVQISYTRPIESVSKTYTTLNPYSSDTVILKVKKPGEGKVTYRIQYPDGTVRYITQEVSSTTYTPLFIKSLQEKINSMEKTITTLKSELEDLKNKVKLPEQIKIDVSNAFVGKTMTVKVLGSTSKGWVPLDRVPVGLDDHIKLTDSSGIAHFIPTEAGTSRLLVYDRFGNIKKDITVKVSKSSITLPMREVKPGEIISYDLPENGSLVVYRDDEVVKTVNTAEFTLDNPGEYTVKYTSPSYNGKGTVIVTGRIIVSATVNGAGLNPGDTVHPGDVIKFGFTYENGMPAKNVDIKISLPATAFGLSEETATLIAMMSDRFEPPFNIVSEKTVDGSTTIVVPKNAEGIIVVKALGNSYAKGGEIAINVEPEPNNLQYALAALLVSSPFVAIISRRTGIGERMKEKLREKITSLRGGGYEPPFE